jgi:hypothetical protein
MSSYLTSKRRAKNSFLFSPLVFKGRAGNGSAFFLSVERFRIRRFGVQARPGATRCGYEIVFAFDGLGSPSPHLDMSGLGQGFSVQRFEENI